MLNDDGEILKFWMRLSLKIPKESKIKLDKKMKLIDPELERKIYCKSRDIGLAKRELECLYWVNLHLKNKEIAGKMKLSVRTVDSYIENIRKKLSCRSKRELVQLVNKFRENSNGEKDNN